MDAICDNASSKARLGSPGSLLTVFIMLCRLCAFISIMYCIYYVASAMSMS